MICPYADFLYDGNYTCGLDGGGCDDPEAGCETVSDLFDDEDYSYLDDGGLNDIEEAQSCTTRYGTA